jgi:hypothetical protein
MCVDEAEVVACDLTTGDVARMVGVRTSTVQDWMTMGVVIDGMRVSLRYQRYGSWRRTCRAWVDEFLEACRRGGEA